MVMSSFSGFERKEKNDGTFNIPKNIFNKRNTIICFVAEIQQNNFKLHENRKRLP